MRVSDVVRVNVKSLIEAKERKQQRDCVIIMKLSRLELGLLSSISHLVTIYFIQH